MAGDGIAFGRYTLLRRLGAGGMGEVWLARQAGPAGFERLVALKQLLPELAGDPALRQLFLDEARIAATLSHPNIAHVYELGEVDGTFFIALEYVFGEDLARIRLRASEAHVAIPMPYAVKIVADLCSALDAAHRSRDAQGRPQQVVHRDVSPQNVLVGFDGVVKLVDFGIARARTAKLGATGQIRGKLAYMAPEQLQPGVEVDGRADVFGAGTVLRDLCGTSADLPEALAKLISRATAHDLNARPTAGELQDELESFLVAERWRVAPRELAAFLKELFGERSALPAEAVEVPHGGNVTATLTLHEVLGYLEAARGPSEEDATALAEPPKTEPPLGMVATSGEPTALRVRPIARAQRPAGGIARLGIAAIAGLVVAGAVFVVVGPRGGGEEEARTGAATATAAAATATATAAESATAAATATATATAAAAASPSEEAGTRSDGGGGSADGLDGAPVAAVEVAPLVPKGARKPRSKPRPSPIVAPEATGHGELTIDTQPWSEVNLGSRRLGVTPLAHVKLRAGRYTLTLVQPESGRRTTREITIRAGEETVLRTKL